MKDFTINIAAELFNELKSCNFYTLQEFENNSGNDFIILRHDVDKNAKQSLKFAHIQIDLSIKGSYYFRIIPSSFQPKIIEQIASMGHEIGYHYEDLATHHGNYEQTIKSFEKNLTALREIAPVQTICMHGSPLRKWDSRLLWTKYNYRDFGIIGEPYFDVNFNEVLYLTDTGRRWDGGAVSIRDKPLDANVQFKVPIKTDRNKPLMSEQFSFHSTQDIIAAAEKKLLPSKVMITFHPQRWTNNPLDWTVELITQNIKNQIKRVMCNSKGATNT